MEDEQAPPSLFMSNHNCTLLLVQSCSGLEAGMLSLHDGYPTSSKRAGQICHLTTDSGPEAAPSELPHAGSF